MHSTHCYTDGYYKFLLYYFSFWKLWKSLNSTAEKDRQHRKCSCAVRLSVCTANKNHHRIVCVCSSSSSSEKEAITPTKSMFPAYSITTCWPDGAWINAQVWSIDFMSLCCCAHTWEAFVDIIPLDKNFNKLSFK